MDAPLALGCAGGRAAVFSRGRPGEAGANEDAAALVSLGAGRGILAVADGAGGHASGAEASAAALGGLLSALSAGQDDGGGMRRRVLDGIERAGEAVTAVGSGAATTLAVLEIDGDTVRPYHVGDREILVLGQRGRIRLQVVPHSPTGYGVESGLLDAEDAIDHEERHVVSNVVGASDMRIEIGADGRRLRRARHRPPRDGRALRQPAHRGDRGDRPQGAAGAGGGDPRPRASTSGCGRRATGPALQARRPDLRPLAPRRTDAVT